MSTRAIRTSTPQTACDVCGRTLLRGERAEIYLAGSSRHAVCELCTARALHGGWVREGTVPAYEEPRARADRRRSRLRRRRPRRAPEPALGEWTRPPMGEPTFFEDSPDPLAEPAEPAEPAWDDDPPTPTEQRSPGVGGSESDIAPHGERRVGRRRFSVGSLRDAAPVREPSAGRDPAASREPRHVRAVPTSVEHKIEAAVELFNGSEHPRTVAGIARSLGLPDVSVHPSDPVASVVNIVVAWELCWYRYEVDLSDEVLNVRVDGQGHELHELSALERLRNGNADERGRLTVIG